MKYFYVAIGGLLGSSFRYWLTFLLPFSQFPIHTLFVNTLGSFLLGYISFCSKFSNNMRLLFGVGFMGAFTTFSTFTFDHVQLLQQGQYALAILYVFLTIGLGLSAAYIGMKFGQRM